MQLSSVISLSERVSEQVIECIFPHPQGRRSIITRQKTQTQLLPSFHHCATIYGNTNFLCKCIVKSSYLKFINNLRNVVGERVRQRKREREWERKRKSVRFFRDTKSVSSMPHTNELQRIRCILHTVWFCRRHVNGFDYLRIEWLTGGWLADWLTVD